MLENAIPFLLLLCCFCTVSSVSNSTGLEWKIEETSETQIKLSWNYQKKSNSCYFLIFGEPVPSQKERVNKMSWTVRDLDCSRNYNLSIAVCDPQCSPNLTDIPIRTAPCTSKIIELTCQRVNTTHVNVSWKSQPPKEQNIVELFILESNKGYLNIPGITERHKILSIPDYWRSTTTDKIEISVTSSLISTSGPSRSPIFGTPARISINDCSSSSLSSSTATRKIESSTSIPGKSNTISTTGSFTSSSPRGRHTDDGVVVCHSTDLSNEATTAIILGLVAIILLGCLFCPCVILVQKNVYDKREKLRERRYAEYLMPAINHRDGRCPRTMSKDDGACPEKPKNIYKGESHRSDRETTHL